MMMMMMMMEGTTEGTTVHSTEIARRPEGAHMRDAGRRAMGHVALWVTKLLAAANRYI